MLNFPRRLAFCAGVCSLSVALVFAQDWKTASTLAGVDLSHLSAPQKTLVLKILRAQGCSCGCSMKLAECRVADPGCAYSTGMAAAVVDAVAHGKSEQDAKAAALASKWGHLQEPKLLDDPVTIPTAGSPVLGPPNAPITLVEFSDFQCPYCAVATPEIKSVLKAFPTQVKLIFKQYPLEIHSQAALAANAALAAQKQGKFWEMHDLLFAHHDSLSRADILAYARQTGLDPKRFQQDLDSTAVHEIVLRDIQDGDHAGVEGTPTLFVNGQKFNGAISVDALRPVFQAELKPATTSNARAAAP